MTTIHEHEFVFTRPGRKHGLDVMCCKRGSEWASWRKGHASEFSPIFGSISDHIFIYFFANAAVQQEKRDQKIGSCVKSVFHGKH